MPSIRVRVGILPDMLVAKAGPVVLSSGWVGVWARGPPSLHSLLSSGLYVWDVVTDALVAKARALRVHLL
jgi:hypothetical protein